MKKLLSLVLVIVLLTALAACSSTSSQPLYTFINDKNASNIKNDAPVKITVVEDHGGAQKIAIITDKDDIATLVDKFIKISVGKDTQMSVTDNYNSITLTWGDESETLIRINLDKLEFKKDDKLGEYELTNLDAFWETAFELGTKEPEIKPTATSKLTLEDYDNGMFSMKIPSGWKVDVIGGVDCIHYTFRVFDPKDSGYQIFFNMKTEGYLSSEKERKWYDSLYPGTPMGTLPAIEPRTTEAFYKILSRAMSIAAPNFEFPTINEFTVIEKIGTNPTGGDILRATYMNEENKKIDGLFSATVVPVSLYYVTANNVYSTVFFTAPENELVEWESVLNKCTESIKFSDEFIKQFGNQEKELAKQIANNAKFCNEMTDIITSGWEQRQSTYDIISQKQSDATLGYERVYDTETGEVYKAYNGFTDDYSGERYQPITDDMYNLAIDGYIEK